MSGIFKNILKPPFKHKKLSEDFASLEQSIGGEGGVSFACRELGSTFVTEAQEESTTADAIRRIVHAARVSNLKPRRVTVQVSSSGVKVQSAVTGESVFDSDIYNITYCSADAHYNHVFAFITTAEKNAYECHAYLCHSAKAARTVSLAIAQAFTFIAQKYLKSSSEVLTDIGLRAKIEQREVDASAKSTNANLVTLDRERKIPQSLDSENSKGLVKDSLPASTSESKFNGENISSDLISDARNSPSKLSESTNIRRNWAAFDLDPGESLEDEYPIYDKLDFMEHIQFPLEGQSFSSTIPNKEAAPPLPPRTQMPSYSSAQKGLSEGAQRVKASNDPWPNVHSFSLSNPDTYSPMITNKPLRKPEKEDKRARAACQHTKWETFNSSSPVSSSSFSDLWNFSSTLEPLSSNTEWTSFSD